MFLHPQKQFSNFSFHIYIILDCFPLALSCFLFSFCGNLFLTIFYFVFFRVLVLAIFKVGPPFWQLLEGEQILKHEESVSLPKLSPPFCLPAWNIGVLNPTGLRWQVSISSEGGGGSTWPPSPASPRHEAAGGDGDATAPAAGTVAAGNGGKAAATGFSERSL